VTLVTTNRISLLNLSKEKFENISKYTLLGFHERSVSNCFKLVIKKLISFTA